MKWQGEMRRGSEESGSASFAKAYFSTLLRQERIGLLYHARNIHHEGSCYSAKVSRIRSTLLLEISSPLSDDADDDDADGVDGGRRRRRSTRSTGGRRDAALVGQRFFLPHIVVSPRYKLACLTATSPARG